MQISKLLSVKKVISTFLEEKIPAKLAYKFYKFACAIETEEKFFNQKMQEVIQTYCAKDENGELIKTEGGFKIAEGMTGECNKTVAELYELEVTAPDIVFNISELEVLNLSVQDMIILSDFIKDSE